MTLVYPPAPVGQHLGLQLDISTIDIGHWWQVELSKTYIIHQIKVFACDGAFCETDGTMLNQILVDIKDVSLVTVGTFLPS